jgi:hypothetical protein
MEALINYIFKCVGILLRPLLQKKRTRLDM